MSEIIKKDVKRKELSKQVLILKTAILNCKHVQTNESFIMALTELENCNQEEINQTLTLLFIALGKK